MKSDKKDRVRTDGRRPLLVYLNENLIKDLKKAALDDDCNVYEIVEQASERWVSERSRKKSG